jgi:glycosyltransferase involved in cell wall biosynthesis
MLYLDSINMKLSIVVPTLNQGCFIEECLLSIQKQTYRDIEIIIQDSLSTDETESICKKFIGQDPRFHYFRESDSGQSDAINRGMNRSTGQLWTWLCSDDYYSDLSALESLVKRIQEVPSDNKKIIGAFGDAQYVTEASELVGPYYNSTRDLTRQDFKTNWPLSQPSSLLLLSAVKEVGGVDASLNLGMDLDLFLKLLKENCCFVYVPKMIVNIRLQPNSKSVKFRKKTAENALTIVKKHFGEVGSPLESAYTREYAVSKRLEVNERIRNILWSVVPFRQSLKSSIQNYESTAIQYIENEKHWSLKLALFHLIWKVYCFIKWRFIFPSKKAFNYLSEVLFRAKSFFIK